MRELFVWLILPPAGPLLLAMAGACMARRWRAGRWMLALGFALAWALSVDAIVEPLGWAWARVPRSAEVAQQLQPWRARPDTVVLVLGGGLLRGAHADGGYDLRLETAERLRRGAYWARQLGLPLAFTGGRSPQAPPDQPAEAELAARVAKTEFGTPLWWVEAESVDTRDNARRTAPLLQAKGIRRVVLVTHATHMPRSLRAFRDTNPDVTFLPAPVGRDWRAPESIAQYLPSATGTQRGRYLVYEWVGYAAGK